MEENTTTANASKTESDIHSPKMIKISFAVPEDIHQQMLEMSAAEGWKPSELCRLAWVMGLNSYAEGSNKRLVNRNLRNKSARSSVDKVFFDKE